MAAAAAAGPAGDGKMSVDPESDRHIVPVVACVLTQMVQRNDTMLKSNPVGASENVTVFHAVKPPTIGLRKYLERIERYAGCSSECYIIALVYVDTIIQRNKSFVISS